MLVTLTGGAGAGRTTPAIALASSAPRGPTSVLHGDGYYVTGPVRGVWTRDEAGVLRLDVGDPRSVDVERLHADTDGVPALLPVVIVDGLLTCRVAPPWPGLRLDVAFSG